MNIAVIAHLHEPISEPFAGGLEAHTYNLVNNLIANGHVVDLYAKEGSSTNAEIIPVAPISYKFRQYKDGSIAYYKQKALLSRFYTRAFTAINTADYDLVINNSLSILPLLTINDTPMLTIFHTPLLPEFTKLKNITYLKNKKFIAVSEIARSLWQGVFDDIAVVHNGIATPHVPIDLQTPTHLTWVGRITPEKGTHIAIQAAKLLRKPLKVAGPIYDQKYFTQEVEPLLGDGIEYVGHLSHEKINELYNHSEVSIVTPMWDEPFGLTTIESLARNVPVAALANGALPEILDLSVGSLADSDSPEDLANAIQRAEKIDRTACAPYVRQRFTIDTMVQNYLVHANELLACTDTGYMTELAWLPK